MLKCIKFGINTIFRNSIRNKNIKLLYNNTYYFSTQEDINKHIKNYEENILKAENKSLQLLQFLKLGNEEKIYELIEEINSYPVKLGNLKDLKEYILSNIDKIPLNSGKPNNICNFLLFIEKLEVDDFEEYFKKIESKILKNLNVYTKENLILILYSLSKYRRFDKNVWDNMYSLLVDKINLLDLSHTTKLLLGLTMAISMESNLLDDNKKNKIYTEVFKNVESKISELKYLDTFRIFISLSKKPVPLKTISERVWYKLQQNFKENINFFDVYQTGQIILLLCEIPYIDTTVFKVVENEILKEYLNPLDDMVKNSGNDLNLPSLFDDISKIAFSMAIIRQGSPYFWNILIKSYVKYHSHVSSLTLENLLFVCNRLMDFVVDNQTKKPDLNNHIENLFRLLLDKIKTEKLLEEKKIDPFNLMMPMSRFISIPDENAWNLLTRNITEAINNKHFRANAYILTDIIMAYANYYNWLISESIENKKQFENNLFLKSFEAFWKRIEELLININENEFDIPNIANISIDLSQIDIELNKAWGYLSDITRLKLKQFDKHNFVLTIMGFSKAGFQEKDLWLDMKSYVIEHINEFKIEELKKLILSFLNIKESSNLWREIENRLCSDEILSEFNFESFNDLQIPLAILGINNEKIWNKFEELVFKNFNTIQNEKDLLLNTVYSFSRIGRGTLVLWQKISTLLRAQMLSYELDDLGHIVVCLKPNVISKNSLSKVIDNEFWHIVMVKMEEKIPHASLNTCNNVLKALKENENTNKNSILIKKVEDKIGILLKKI